jgi:hypothetical protein
MWGIWIARNDILFEYNMMKNFQEVTQFNNFFVYCKINPEVKPHKIISMVHVDKSLTLGFFHGACQGPYSINGIGFILYFTKTQRAQVKGHIGRETNNKEELKALYYLLISSLDRAIDKLRSMGDSSMVINLMKEAFKYKIIPSFIYLCIKRNI